MCQMREGTVIYTRILYFTVNRWSYGVVLYEIFTVGRSLDLIAQIISRAVRHLVLKCTVCFLFCFLRLPILHFDADWFAAW